VLPLERSTAVMYIVVGHQITLGISSIILIQVENIQSLIPNEHVAKSSTNSAPGIFIFKRLIDELQFPLEIRNEQSQSNNPRPYNARPQPLIAKKTKKHMYQFQFCSY